jgi:hypothetical protein
LFTLALFSFGASFAGFGFVCFEAKTQERADAVY